MSQADVGIHEASLGSGNPGLENYLLIYSLYITIDCGDVQCNCIACLVF